MSAQIPLVESWLDTLVSDFNERHQWLFEAGEQIRKWREEDRRNGILWNDETPKGRERGQ